jgi:colanic acid/amylovoran biosynthesis glycosyltransferase
MMELLIYAPVPLYRSASSLTLEAQASNGLRLWADNFEKITVMMPVTDARPPAGWVPLKNIGPALERIEIEPLPMAYRPDQFLRHLPQTRRRIRRLIERADYLGFTLSGLIGDWGAVASYEAIRMDRPFFLWADRVESEVVRRTASEGPWRRRWRAHLEHRPMAWVERALVRRAALGLFHGKETYDTYAPFCADPHVVHDVHLKRADHISRTALERKITNAHDGPLKICYVGRADAMKGPLDWVEVLRRLSAKGVSFNATWLGDGTLLKDMRERVDHGGISAHVSLPGFTEDRERVLNIMREAHVFLFCHKTPESPRCLIEALASGCPIIGYDGAFARDLTTGHGGGAFTAINAVDDLAGLLAKLAAERSRLGEMIAAAAKDGVPFVDELVFRHRSDLIKTKFSTGKEER